MRVLQVVALVLASCGEGDRRLDGLTLDASPDAAHTVSDATQTASDAVQPLDDARQPLSDAGPQCVFQGMFYDDGATFPAGDGCNTCYCNLRGNEPGVVSCTLIGCFDARPLDGGF